MWHRQSLQHQDLQECDLHFCMFQPAQCWDRAGQLSPNPVANRLEYAAALSSDLVPPSDPHCLKKPYFLAPSLCSLTYELSHYWPPIVLKRAWIRNLWRITHNGLMLVYWILILHVPLWRFKVSSFILPSHFVTTNRWQSYVYIHPRRQTHNYYCTLIILHYQY